MVFLAIYSSKLLQLKLKLSRLTRIIPYSNECKNPAQQQASQEKKARIETHKADLAFIGVGPSGMFGSLRAKANGIKKVIVVDKHPALGGTCINFGCIPTKTLLNFSNNFYKIKSGFFIRHGIRTGEVKLDMDKMMCQKSHIMKELSSFMEDIFKSQGIKIIRGAAKFTSPTQLSVATDEGNTAKVEAENFIIGTGSKARSFPGVDIDEKTIMTSDGAILMNFVPKRMGVIGTGVIACEMGSCWQKLGSKVTLISNEPMVVGPRLDKDIRLKFQDILGRQGIRFILNAKVLGASKCGKFTRLLIEDKHGEKHDLEFDVIMISIGRIPYTAGLGLNKAGVITDENGSIPVKTNFETNVPHIFAVGDVTPGPMMAHKAAEQSITCVDIICGKEASMNIDNVPLVVYTSPEVASIGRTEDELKEQKIPYRVTRCSMRTCAMARCDADMTGLMKGLVCPKTNKILGTHMVCAHAGELINEIVMARQYGITAEQVCRVVHGHPSYAKMFKTLYGL